MIPLFHAGRQLSQVRSVMFLSLACAAASVRAGVHLMQTYGLNPADGGVLATLSVRLTWGSGVALLGVGFAVGMWLYGRCYVVTVRFDPQTQSVHIGTLRLFGSAQQVFAVSDIRSSRYHKGKLTLGVFSVDAPWYSLRIVGRRLPLIIDGQGVILRQELMNWLVGLGSKRQGRTVMRKYRIRYFFEYGTGCLWSADEYTSDRFDWYIDPEKLPLSPETIARIDELADWYQGSLNWESPADPSPWEREESDRFNQAADELFRTLQSELGEGFAVVNQQTQ